MYLFPLSLNILDRAVELRKKCARAAAKASGVATSATNINGKRQRDLDNDFHEVQAESSYLLLSHTRSSLTSTMSMETDIHRTGRWTAEEIGYVDFLLNAFDRGLLTLPHGIKLNEFLGDVLLCKSSRLTKKMKNAKLSTRSYGLSPPMPNSELLDNVVMSRLEEKFLHSLSSEATQLELLFNLTKLWRTNLSNLCLQVGYSFLEAGDWVGSLEAMERRASEAEEMIRKARRKRMGLALKTDVKSSNPGVFFANRPVAGRENTIIPTAPKSMNPQVATSSSISFNKNMFENNAASHSVSSEEASDADFITHMLELSSQPGPDGQRNRLLSMDLGDGGFDDYFAEPSSDVVPTANKKTSEVYDHGPFLHEIISFLEKNHLPFVHVDVWVPSIISDGENQDDSKNSSGEEGVRLYHAGCATRGDLNQMLTANFNEFGVYSKKFSFASGVGLPGRVFATGKPDWSSRVHEADPKYFERAGGARIYGVKTVLGIPLDSSIGKLVVALYTSADIQRNDALIAKCASAFSTYAPEPKWRLVVEMGSKGDGASADAVASFAEAPAPADFDYSKCFEDDDFAPLPTINQETASVCTSVAASVTEADTVAEEQKIATLLGEYMPLSQPPSSAGEATVSSSASPGYLNEFMQLRLLLLRPRSKRAASDNELIDILRNSFHGYSKGNRRAGTELAILLVKDWRFLKSSTVTAQAPAAQLPKQEQQDPSQYQSHTMDTPKINTYSSTGGPLNFSQSMLSQSLSQRRMDPMRDSFDGSAASGFQSRRISVASEVPESPRSNVNLVSETC